MHYLFIPHFQQIYNKTRESMKIVQINTVCNTGSTGKIAADLYYIAEKAGDTSFIAYGRGTAPKEINSFKIGNPIDFMHHVLINFFLGKSGFGSKTVTVRFLKWLDAVKPDVLHLHNLHGFYIHVEMLFEYIKIHHIPIVWTLHDCWPLTGQCAHFDYAGCTKWQTACKHCPIYRSNYPYSLFRDNSRQNYELKKAAFTGVENLTIVTPSNWLADIVKKSFLREYPVMIIPNGINLDIFKPAVPQSTNTVFATANSTFVTAPKIILGVANVWTSRKGLDFFLKLSELLDSSYHIILIGVSQKQQKKLQKEYGGRITPLTRTANQLELAKWYSRAYVYVNPTLEDNFPTTNLEALACGTPVITFNTGGSPESISPQCGLIVEKGNIEKLKEAILSLDRMTAITSSACRTQALKYDKDVRFSEYLKIYHSLSS